MSMENNKTNRAFFQRIQKFLPTIMVVSGVAIVILLIVALPAREKTLPPVKPPIVNVEIEEVHPLKALADRFIIHGVIEPNLVVRVGSEVNGQIETQGVRRSEVTWLGKTYPAGSKVLEGEPITQGDLLIRLNTDLLQAEYDQAKAQTDYDTREYERMEDLFNKKVAARGELDAAKTKMQVSLAALARAKQRLDRAQIDAPISGILNDFPEEIGQFVQPGTLVAEIVDTATVKVNVDIPEKDIAYLSLGDSAQILLDENEGKKITGQITFIGEMADPATRTTLVRISIDNHDRLVRSGQIVRVIITRRILDDVIMVPLSAIIPLEVDRVVYVVDEHNQAQRKLVKLDRLMKGARIRVLDGIQPGDKLIVSGHRYVGPGQDVRVVGTRKIEDFPSDEISLK